ncbi:hypothetical protein NE237_011674 [Protea cynaroides]|uniref:SMP domain-containing protein n=1 Tax=Protea cynaroides TaxID=273540 RepID=A0A9Q0GVD5_9MAGN|nr:hypothetical protein NE237_011674 [Protea cynaroides]
MSQQQPEMLQHGGQEQPIKYSDVFTVSGDLASEPIAPQDAAMMQTAENLVFGKTKKGGTAAAMQSASTLNERAGLVGSTDTNQDVAGDKGVTVAEMHVSGRRIVMESVAGQVVEQYVEPEAVHEENGITIGEALEASALTAGEKPVDRSDAAAIQAAEVRATGRNEVMAGGVAAAAQSAANLNEGIIRDEDKVKLADVLTDAAEKLAADKKATRQDAEGVVAAELRNDPNLSTHPGGVAASVTAAARLNENPQVGI